jgi:WD40 repeat protein
MIIKKKNKKEEIKLNLLETLKNVHDDIIRNIVLYQNKAIITSGEDNKVKVWDFN